MHILIFKLDFDSTGYLDDVHLLINLGQAALVIFIIFAIISILLIIISCCCITITKTRPYAGYNMTAKKVANTKSPSHSKGITNLLPDSCSSSVSVTNERQMNTNNRRRTTEDEAGSCGDRVGRRFPGTTVTPQVIYYHFLLVHNLD